MPFDETSYAINHIGNKCGHDYEESLIMLSITHNREASLDCYILNEDPMTCGMCGARTSFEYLEGDTQVHQCLSSVCGYRFIVVDDMD